MAKSRVLVKNLATIETLSMVNVIASDKTGTLTQNKMFVASAAAPLKDVDLKEAEKKTYEYSFGFNQLVSVAGLCNNAEFDKDDMDKSIRFRKCKGDATDIALLRFNAEFNRIPDFEDYFKTLAEIPFNSKNKWMAKVLKALEEETSKKIFGESYKLEWDIILIKGFYLFSK